MRLRSFLIPFPSIIELDSSYSGSKSSWGYGSTPPASVPSVACQLKADSHFGSLLADANGTTLYVFSLDANGTAADFSHDAVWPVVRISSAQNVPSSLDKTAFSSITVFTKPQLSYKGCLIYKFGADANTRGKTRGVSVPTPDSWF